MERLDYPPNQAAYFEPLPWLGFLGMSVVLALAGLVAGFFFWVLLPYAPDFDAKALWSFALFILAGGAAVVVTLIKIFGRIGVVIDRSAGTVDAYWGVVFAFPSAQISLRACEQLVMNMQEVHGYDAVQKRNTVRFQYQLRLVGRSVEPLLIGLSEDYGNIRVMAEELGEFIGLDLLDTAVGPAEFVRHAHLCQPAWKRGHAPLASQPLPASGPLTYRPEGKTLHVGCQSTGDIRFVYAGVAALAVVPAVAVVLFRNYWHDPLACAFVLIFCGAAVTILLTLLRAFQPSRSTVSASPQQLTLTTSNLLGTSRTEIPAESIWQIRARALGLGILTSGGDVPFWTPGAAAEDLERLRTHLLFFLAGGRK